MQSDRARASSLALCTSLRGIFFLNSQTRFRPKPMLISYLGTDAAELIPQPQVCLVGTDSQPLASLVSSRAVPHQLVVTVLLPPPHRQAWMQAHNRNVSAFTLTLTSHIIKIKKHTHTNLHPHKHTLLKTHLYSDNV